MLANHLLSIGLDEEGTLLLAAISVYRTCCVRKFPKCVCAQVHTHSYTHTLAESHTHTQAHGEQLCNRLSPFHPLKKIPRITWVWKAENSLHPNHIKSTADSLHCLPVLFTWLLHTGRLGSCGNDHALSSPRLSGGKDRASCTHKSCHGSKSTLTTAATAKVTQCSEASDALLHPAERWEGDWLKTGKRKRQDGGRCASVTSALAHLSSAQTRQHWLERLLSNVFWMLY